MTEREIEARAERLMDHLDNLFMDGKISQKDYDQAVFDLKKWAEEKYRQRTLHWLGQEIFHHRRGSSARSQGKVRFLSPTPWFIPVKSCKLPDSQERLATFFNSNGDPHVDNSTEKFTLTFAESPCPSRTRAGTTKDKPKWFWDMLKVGGQLDGMAKPFFWLSGIR
jgi:hypothetical protein